MAAGEVSEASAVCVCGRVGRWAGGRVSWRGEGGGVFSSARTLHRVLSHEFDHARVLVEDGGVQLQPVVAHRVAYDGRSKQLLDGVEGVELDLA